MDQSTLEALAGEAGLKLGMQAEFTLANFGRSYTGSVYFNTSAAGKTVSIAFSKGFFGGISFEGAVVGTRKALNQAFYDSNIGALELIMGRDVAMPEGTMIDDVYKKLDMVKKGKRADEHREG